MSSKERKTFVAFGCKFKGQWVQAKYLKIGVEKMQRIHHWIAPLLMYNGLTNTGLVINDILYYFF